jgi:arylsulfatase A
VRVPLIVRWTKHVKAGTVVDTPIISTDWTPTLLALATAQAKESFEGANCADLLLHGRAPPPRPLFWHQPHYTNQGGRPAGAIRDGNWKLFENYENGACELYDLATDPGEATDLAAKEPARVAQMRGKLEEWRRAVKAQENTANPKFNGAVSKRLYRDFDSSQMKLEDKASLMAAKMEPWRALMNDVLANPKKKIDAKIETGSGAVILHAKNAKVTGTKLRYEDQPHKDTLGFWVQKSDGAEWTFELPHAGKFDVEVLQACGKGSGGAEVEFAVAKQTLTMKVEETGHFQRFVPRTIGTMTFDTPGKYTLTVRAMTKPGPAVMDLRRVVLRAAP